MKLKILYDEIFEEHSYLKNGITLNEDSCVIDVGANAGFFTVFLNVLSKNIKGIHSNRFRKYIISFPCKPKSLYNVNGKAFELAILDKEQEIDFTFIRR
jgi:hypothetical protein